MASISGVSSASWPSSTYPPSSPSTSPTFSFSSSSSTVPYVQCCPERRLTEPRCCTHLASFKAAGGMESLHAVLQLLNAWKLGLVKKPRPLQFRCAVCGDYNGRLHVCCHCVHIACWDKRHFHEHFLFTKQAHYLAVEATQLQLYCFGCGDYVYDHDFDHISQCERAHSIGIQQSIQAPSEKRASYTEWIAGSQEAQLLSKEVRRQQISSAGSFKFQPPTDLASNPLSSSAGSASRNRPPSSSSSPSPSPSLSSSFSRLPLSSSTSTSVVFPGLGDLAPPSSSLVGLRGLINLGNTCFMNTILQSFLHNPLMRNYFLSDLHNRNLCKRVAGLSSSSHFSNSNGHNSSSSSLADVCLACELDNIFSQAFGPQKPLATGSTPSSSPVITGVVPSKNGTLNGTGKHGASDSHSAMGGTIYLPFTPHNFLYGIWKHTDYLAGYEQQDAHEFLISALNGIHNHSTPSPSPSTTISSKEECRCIVHRIFAGELRSDVTCLTCGTTSTANDPFFDISLDIPKQARKPSDGTTSNGNLEGLPCTLFDCLSKFTQPEKLESKEGFFCSTCKSKQESFKQLSMKKLPTVICFHVKRFEHTNNHNVKSSTKVDTYIGFPEELDMYPYLSSTLLKRRQQATVVRNPSPLPIPSFSSPPSRSNGGNSNSGSGRYNNTPPIDPEEFRSEHSKELYQLFSVINHTGKMDTGHYTCFVRQAGDLWVKCDDAWITRASLKTVLASNGYLLFYVRKFLEYEHSA